MDALDIALIGRLCRDGRATWAELATEVGLTPPAVAARVRRLEAGGIIRQFAALADPERVGAVTAFVEVTFDDPQAHDEFRQVVTRLVAVQECHRVAGDAHYLVKVRARSSSELESLLAAVLPKAARGATFRVSMVLTTVKESPVFPLPKLD
ncbi:MAG TPA: Lrp/AsnC family transcriptional regulator [Vicinamibacterales bacterium]|nr:Lrp/AsnC family transcriptional regulator [Vicinamibacterales bacterium]